MEENNMKILIDLIEVMIETIDNANNDDFDMNEELDKKGYKF